MFKQLIPIVLVSLTLSAKEISIDLNDPVYRGSTISTNAGGVIKSDDLRVQAQNIEITEINGEQLLRAERDLLVVLDDKYLVGDLFTYNLTTGAGELTNGISMIDQIFVGGETIVFHSDGKIEAKDPHFTPLNDKSPIWKVKADSATIETNTKAKATNVKLNVLNTPIMWLPTYSKTINPKYSTVPTVGANVYYEGGEGLLALNYKVLDEKNLKVFARGDLRRTKGLGGSIDVKWASDDSKQKLAARNFYAYDRTKKTKTSEVNGSRFRVQGMYNSKSTDGMIDSKCAWDVVSDPKVGSDLPNHNADIKTSYRNEANVRVHHDAANLSAYFRPRLNSFNGFKQELPMLTAAMKPVELGGTGIIFENTFKAGYLDFAYSSALNHALADYNSGRLQSEQSLSRPFNFSGISILPKVAAKGVLYSNSPSGTPQRLLSLQSSLEARTAFEGDLGSYSHLIEPYMQLKYQNSPTTATKDIHIFSLEDSFTQLNQMKFGINNSFFAQDTNALTPTIGIDLFAYTFSNVSPFSASPTELMGMPKVGADLSWQASNLSLKSSLGWNVAINTYDYANLFAGYTYSDKIAVSAELRNRGLLHLRKCDQTNYTLDASRTPRSLLASVLSDPRTTFITRLQLELAPMWTVQFQSQAGLRPDLDPYYEYGVNLNTLVSNRWVVSFMVKQSTSGTQDYKFKLDLM